MRLDMNTAARPRTRIAPSGPAPLTPAVSSDHVIERSSRRAAREPRSRNGERIAKYGRERRPVRLQRLEPAGENVEQPVADRFGRRFLVGSADDLGVDAGGERVQNRVLAAKQGVKLVEADPRLAGDVGERNLAPRPVRRQPERGIHHPVRVRSPRRRHRPDPFSSGRK